MDLQSDQLCIFNLIQSQVPQHLILANLANKSFQKLSCLSLSCEGVNVHSEVSLEATEMPRRFKNRYWISEHCDIGCICSKGFVHFLHVEPGVDAKNVAPLFPPIVNHCVVKLLGSSSKIVSFSW